MKPVYFILITSIFGCIACKEEYDPGIKSMEGSLLVVEGNLNVTHDSTIIQLSRTYKLDDSARKQFVNNANLLVEGSDGSIRQLIFIGNGKYVSPDLNLVIGNDYRLRIKLTFGQEYLSEYVKAKATPPIDSIGWEMDGADVQVYVNTHDPTGTSRYYRWEYDETWEIHSYYFSYYIYVNTIVRERVFPQENVYYCWRHNSNSNILLANSIQLQDDIIYKKPLIKILSGDDRLQVRYSMLLKQYSIEKKAYDFYEMMKKNTEQIGSLFSPQPSEIHGNIRCISDSTEPVIGYITASEKREKRVFITVPTWNYEFSDCATVIIPDIRESIIYYFQNKYIPYAYFNVPLSIPVYYGALPHCVDCRTRNATTVKPFFW